MKKRIWAALLVLALCLGMAAAASAADGTTWDGITAATGFAGGLGTESDPYRIETAGQLIYLRNKVNGGKTYDGEYFRLNADLDMAGKDFGDAIGNTKNYVNQCFNGHFDGGNYKISNLTIGNANGYSALFGNVGWNNQEAVIKNLTLVNVNVKRTLTNYGAAALVGNAGYLKLEECTVESGTVQTNSYTAGGFVANAGSASAKGLAVINCENKANITQTGSSGNGTGGIVGQGCNQSGNGVTTITGCINYGDVSGRSYAAGIIGNAYVATVEKCANYGDISAIGTSGGTYQKTAKAAGILVSGSDKVTTIKNCYNVGNISSDGTTTYDDATKNAGGAAGIAAFNSSSSVQKTITNCHNVGTVTGDYGYPIGLRSKSITNAFYLNATSKNNSKATQKTEEEFADGTVYNLLQDANNDQVWGQTIGTDDYPVFYNGSNVPVPPHECDWTYSADGNTIKAACKYDGCSNGNTELTISAPALTIYGGTESAEAVLSAASIGGVTALPAIQYQVKTGSNAWGEATAVAPTAPDSYKASITVEGATAYVEYTIGKRTITSAAVEVTAPVQGEAPQSSVASGMGYTAEISWSPAVAGGVFGFDMAYTATITLTPGSSYAFTDATAVPEEFGKILNADGTLTLTKTFAKTRVPNLTKLKTALGSTLSVYCKDAAEVIALLPTQMTYETETGDLTLDVAWSCGSYDPEVGRTNAFAWAVQQSAWEAVKDSYHQNDVPLSGTVNLTNAEAIPVVITGTAAMQELVYDGAAKQGYTGTPASAEYAGPFTITYAGMKADGSGYGPTSEPPTDAGEYTVTIAVPAVGTAYSGETQLSFSIAKAVPTGEPVFTQLYRDGKTLADAGLTAEGGTFSVAGTVAWDDSLSATVEEGKAYAWTFTPANSGNYEAIRGSAVIYPAGDAPTITEPVEMQAISAAPGAAAVMTIAAQGTGELTYQWFVCRDGGKTFEAISGATQPTCTINALTTDSHGDQYCCLVSNLYGEMSSPIFVLSVVDPTALPQTGDRDNPALWMMLLLSAGAVVLMMRRRRIN